MRLLFLKLVLLGLLVFSSCEEKPLCTLSDEQMVHVLTDIQIAEAAAQSLGVPIKDSILQMYYQQVFEIHEVEEARFKECFLEFQADPDRMKVLFDSVLEELDRLEAQEPDPEEEEEEED